MKEFARESVLAIVLLSLTRFLCSINNTSEWAALLWGVVPLFILTALSMGGEGILVAARLTHVAAIGWGFLSGYVFSTGFSLGPLTFSVLGWFVVVFCSNDLARIEDLRRTPVLITVLGLGIAGMGIFYWQWGRVLGLLLVVVIAILRGNIQENKQLEAERAKPAFSSSRLKTAR